jgi:hypothetical protein
VSNDSGVVVEGARYLRQWWRVPMPGANGRCSAVVAKMKMSNGDSDGDGSQAAVAEGVKW